MSINALEKVDISHPKAGFRMREWRFHVRDVMHYSERISVWTEGHSQESFMSDEKCCETVLSMLLFMGGSVQGIPEQVREAYIEIDWDVLLEVREDIIKRYESLDILKIWKIIQNTVPRLPKVLKRILRETGEGPMLVRELSWSEKHLAVDDFPYDPSIVGNRNELLRILRGYKKDLVKRFGLKRLALFGSFARDEVTDRSDVDLLVTFEKVSDLYHFIKVQSFLQDILGRRVNLRQLDGLRSEIKPYVLQDMVRV